MSDQIIFTVDELYQFSKIAPLTIQELSRFIEDKTGQQYVIVQKEFVKAISKQLNNNTFYIIDINKFINDNWVELVSTNQATTNKWKNELSVFEE